MLNDVKHRINYFNTDILFKARIGPPFIWLHIRMCHVCAQRLVRYREKSCIKFIYLLFFVYRKTRHISFNTWFHFFDIVFFFGDWKLKLPWRN